MIRIYAKNSIVECRFLHVRERPICPSQKNLSFLLSSATQPPTKPDERVKIIIPSTHHHIVFGSTRTSSTMDIVVVVYSYCIYSS